MKYIKLYEGFEDFEETWIDEEEEKRNLEIIGYPSGKIIRISDREFDILYNDADLLEWDSEPFYDPENPVDGYWRYRDSSKQDIKDLLERDI